MSAEKTQYLTDATCPICGALDEYSGNNERLVFYQTHYYRHMLEKEE